MKKLLFLLFLCYNLSYSQYTEVYYNDFKSGAALTEWSTDKPIAGAWNNPISCLFNILKLYIQFGRNYEN